MKHVPRTVVALGATSFLTDFSSEMIYPLLPAFLTTVLRAGPVALGVIEGVAETTAALLKVVSGMWTDRVARRKPFVVVGYGLAGAVRPLIGLATAWPFVLAMRFLDRVGKGIRSSPRDALIADVVEPAHRGEAYGFQRAMDHAGAVAGPLVAWALLLAGFQLQSVFLLAAVPAVLVMIVLIAGVREPERRPTASHQALSLRAHWKEFGRDFRMMMVALFVFTLGNSTDAFILLRLADAGVPTAWVAVLWALHHVVKMVVAYWGGILSDKVGRRKMILAGWGVYALIYCGFAVVQSVHVLIAVFLAYGIYFGCVEPSERAWVADLAPAHLRGTAQGYYQGAVGLGALPASLIFGLLWHTFSAATAFGFGAALAAAGSLLLLTVREPKR